MKLLKSKLYVKNMWRHTFEILKGNIPIPNKTIKV